MEAAVIAIVFIIFLAMALFSGSDDWEGEIEENMKEFKRDRIERKQ
ncbi:MAG: hypothetical protein KA369_08500 [Spirochaetes bacterium]|nr:hypothetical protein [Spirochaetota bacterium]